MRIILALVMFQSYGHVHCLHNICIKTKIIVKNKIKDKIKKKKIVQNSPRAIWLFVIGYLLRKQ